MNIVEIGLRISVELGLKTGRFGIPCGIRPKKNIYYGIRPNVKMDFGFSSNENQRYGIRAMDIYLLWNQP